MSTPSRPAGKPIVVWDAVVSGALFVVLLVELVLMAGRLTPDGVRLLANPVAYVGLAIAAVAAVIVIVRVRRRRLAFWVVLIFVVAVPIVTIGITVLILLVAFGP
ncbi:hypothetical protein [Spelaeicoccus albus]|uniref:Uncharacterized protein n=1 Tax=Spelaeicoccus albus TaxID=1280376 RepID=A0A7Z0IHF3_9MICO|nr:hypothetical protein [Spelaeicoccus albus]NYI67700.1 hypothetical protein [Spelaeicoccus albus]